LITLDWRRDLFANLHSRFLDPIFNRIHILSSVNIGPRISHAAKAIDIGTNGVNVGMKCHQIVAHPALLPINASTCGGGASQQ
jgi:hypothetical protein